MKRFLPFLALGVIGCSTPKPEAANPETPNSTGNQVGSTTGGGGGVTPMASGAATGMTPMSGTENVGGGGMGGVGQAAKDQARRAAAGPQTPPPSDGDAGE